MVRDLLGYFNGETLRFALLSAHYRSGLTFSSDLLEQAKSALDSLYGSLRGVSSVAAISPNDLSEQPVYLALLDDLNTPVAIRELHQLAKAMMQASGDQQARLKGMLLACAELMGLLQQTPKTWFQSAVKDGAIDTEAIETLIQARDEAKLAKDYARADAIRNQLSEAGVQLEDGQNGTIWRRG